ncbi:glycerophosphoryl diester phosphodiesterase [bacterium A37T11]|nr:glycerophosphoryl diester phosphodiesterase [bacterium A37T11]
MKINVNLLLLVAMMGISSCKTNYYKHMIIAHRGAWKTAGLPENSIASLDKAMGQKLYGSEFDVHLTKDGILVVNHNNDFYGVDIATATYQGLLGKKHPNGERIPTLGAYLREGLKQKKTKLILEIKTSNLGEERTLESTRMIVDTVKSLNAQKLTEYICFDYEVGKLVHLLDTAASVAYLNGDKSPAELKEDGYKGIDYHISVYDKHPEWIPEAKKLGLSVNVWTVNSPDDMKRFIKQQVNYITTNEPELLFDLLRGKK